MSDVLYFDLRVTPNELRAIEKMREERVQGFACDDGIVRCRACTQTALICAGVPVQKALNAVGKFAEDDAVSPVEKYTPRAFDGDDFCSDCDVDIKAKDYPTPEEIRA